MERISAFEALQTLPMHPERVVVVAVYGLVADIQLFWAKTQELILQDGADEVRVRDRSIGRRDHVM